VGALARRLLPLAALLAVVAAPAGAGAQVFLASRPHPGFTVGPVSVRAAVTPQLGPTDVRILWGLVVPADLSPATIEQDLYLLWPGAVDGDTVPGPPDAALAAYVRERGFTVIQEGRLPLAARQLFGGRNRPKPQPLPGGAPFVSYVRETGALERSATATWIRIPWTPALVNRTYLIELRMRLPELVHERRASALEKFVWGRRYSLALGFSDVRTRAAYPMYLEHRDRVIRLAEDPSQVTVRFESSDRLKIYEVIPATSRRQTNENRHSENVSIYLDPAEGLRPQVLTLQFGYFTDWTSWAPVLFAALFFLLGNIAGPIVAVIARRYGARLVGRIHVGRRGPRERQIGTLVPRETLARIAPGVTTLEELIGLCGPGSEEHEQFAAPDRRVIVYRGRKIAPRRRRGFAWVATLSGWDVEHHEVEVTLVRGVVQDVQARVRRTHLTGPEEPPR
jgi:hypothetical protein